MEELDQISPKDKLSFKEHYFKIQYALEKVSQGNGSRDRAKSSSCSRDHRRLVRLNDIY